MTIRLVLVDDHPITLEGLAQLFSTEPDFEVVARATSGYPGSLHNFKRPPGARLAMLEKPFTPRMLTDALARLLGEESSAD